MMSLLRLQNNFPLKFVLSRYVILKACETESKQVYNRGKKPHCISFHSCSQYTLTGFAKNDLAYVKFR